jgi:signal transduction histidine kinase
MIRKRRWLWIVLFIFGAVLWTTLATGWNVVIVRDYHRMLELAKSSMSNPSGNPSGNPREDAGMGPWPIVIFGWLGFVAALGTLILFFVKTLREMRLNQLQAEFLATVSHELKTPIASIELTSSLLRTGDVTQEEAERLWTSHQLELKRLRSEVETILEAARWQANPMRARPVPLDLEDWVVQSMSRWQNILGKGARLVREGDPLPRNTKLDPKSLNLIMDNLLDNARKFSRGNPSVTIRTGYIPGKGPFGKSQWQIEVHDQGWGFDPQESHKLFQRFFRARTDAPYSIPGTGLGLYLASSASRSLGIRITGYSPGLGQGAVFMLTGKHVPAEVSQVKTSTQNAAGNA